MRAIVWSNRDQRLIKYLGLFGAKIIRASDRYRKLFDQQQREIKSSIKPARRLHRKPMFSSNLNSYQSKSRPGARRERLGNSSTYFSSAYVNFMLRLCFDRKVWRPRGISILLGCGIGQPTSIRETSVSHSADSSSFSSFSSISIEFEFESRIFAGLPVQWITCERFNMFSQIVCANLIKESSKYHVKLDVF